MTMRTVGDWNEEGKREAAALEELRSALVETVSGADALAGGKVDGVVRDGGRMRYVRRDLGGRAGRRRQDAAGAEACAVLRGGRERSGRREATKRSAKKLCRRLLEEGRLDACCGGPARARGIAPRRPDTSPRGAATSNTQNIVLWCATNTSRASERNGPVSTLLRRVGAAPRDGA